jgi:hypothetical protein
MRFLATAEQQPQQLEGRAAAAGDPPPLPPRRQQQPLFTYREVQLEQVPQVRLACSGKWRQRAPSAPMPHRPQAACWLQATTSCPPRPQAMRYERCPDLVLLELRLA